MIGKIERLALRDVWKHEAHDFTKWLQENLDILSEVIDINLVSADREQAAGDFNVDLIAEDEDSNTVIIENQLAKSDHDHLGKVITYLTAFEAKAAIWIVSEPRPEHVRAITWLNETSAASFYLLKMEAIRIGDSAPAPLLTLIVGPSEESREVGETKKGLSERHTLRNRFWEQLLEMAKGKTKLHGSVSAGHSGWIGTGAGKSGLGFDYAIRQHDGNAELYIDRGKDSEEESKKIFDTLLASKDSIEQEFGGPLEWQRLDGSRACRIKKDVDKGGYRDEESKWPEIQADMIDAMIRLEKALKPHIAGLQI
jgi:hypothetical protein